MDGKFLFFFLSLICVSPQIQASSQSKKNILADHQILHVSNGAEPREIDPALATGIPESHIIDSIFEGLTTTSPFDDKIHPGVAESWTVSSDGTSYVFKIRKNAKWSDGQSLTAKDFVFSWERALSPKTASEYAYQLYPIKNAEKYNLGTLKDFKQVGVKAKDEYTLEVNLERPTHYFLLLTSFMTLLPTPEHVIKKFQGLEWTRDKNIVSNGPFKVKEAKLQESIKLIANEFYWNKKDIKLKEIVIYPFDNKTTEEQNFITGKIHMTSTLPAMRVPYYKSNFNNKYNPMKNFPVYGTFYFRFNTTRKPLNDPRVRQALSMVIDRSEIVQNITRRGEIPARSFTPPYASYEFKGNLPIKISDEVIQEAKKLLAQAGYPGGKFMPKLNILYETDEDNKRIAVAVQNMWKKTLGVEVGIYNEEWKVYLDSLHKLNFDIARSRWIGDYPDPNTFLECFLTNGGNNNTGWSNKNYDDLVKKAASTKDTQERLGFFQKAEEILMKEAPISPVYYYSNTHLLVDNLKLFNPKDQSFHEWKADPMDHWYFSYTVLVK